MVEVIITEKNGFEIIGKKVWVGGTDNEQFGNFWRKSHEDGSIELIKKYNLDPKHSVTKSSILGLSCTENDPNNRNFWFYIGVETKEKAEIREFENYKIRGYKWAIFRTNGNDIKALMECEMYAWKHWLLENGKFIHDNGPELEVYFGEDKIEYWLPIREK
jgi:predicted transcriptional regulator YdeE